jgi:hypothetical protein
MNDVTQQGHMRHKILSIKTKTGMLNFLPQQPGKPCQFFHFIPGCRVADMVAWPTGNLLQLESKGTGRHFFCRMHQLHYLQALYRSHEKQGHMQSIRAHWPATALAKVL